MPIFCLSVSTGGLHVDAPDKNPIDSKTGLAVGDVRRIGLFALIVVGLFVLNVVLNAAFLL